jgi:aryl-alcohol dehydrogenase-like predicted oxidoreductase
MHFKEFGKTGMKVSEVGFGGSRIGGVFAQKNGSKEALDVLQKALDAGINFYDTSDMYSQGESESLIGKAFQNRRDQVILATKGGFCLPRQRKLIARIKPLVRPLIHALGMKRARLPASASGALSQDFTSASLTQALEASLRRLRTDHVDLYQLHSPPPEFLQSGAFGETLETLEKLKGQGKIRFYGVATEAPSDAALCVAHPTSISSVQLGFGLLDLDALEDGTLVGASAQNLGIIARGCFGGGLLKEDLTEAQLKEMTPKWTRIVRLRACSQKLGRSVLESALHFCLYTSPVTVTLLGMRTIDHLVENLRYYEKPPLTTDEYTALYDHAKESA